MRRSKTLPSLTLKKRGLSEEVISSGRVLSASKWLRKAGKEELCCGFPYVDPVSDNIYAVKYRGIEIKDFIRKGSASSFYGVERVKPEDPIVIVEGEIDALSLGKLALRTLYQFQTAHR